MTEIRLESNNDDDNTSGNYSSSQKLKRDKRNKRIRYLLVAISISLIFGICFHLIQESSNHSLHISIDESSMERVFFQPNVRNNNNNGTLSSSSSYVDISNFIGSKINRIQQKSNSTSIVTEVFVTTTTTTTNSSLSKPLKIIIPPKPLSRLPIITKTNPLPPLEDIKRWMQNDTTKTDGYFILDFAIVGFAKCGTSTMMTWLGQHPEILMPLHEQRILAQKAPWDLVERLYEPQINDYHYNNSNASIKFRGYKAPNDIGDVRPIRLLREYFPQTKLIIGIRHPVLMMQSFYNHRVHNGFPIVPFTEISRGNPRNHFGVTWRRAEYQGSLIHLGKTNLTSTQEIRLMSLSHQVDIQRNGLKFERSPHPVFLYEVDQLKNDSDDNESSSKNNNNNLDVFVKSLENFLGLTHKLPPPVHEKPGKKLSEEEQATRDALKIDICLDRYKHQRKELLKIGAKVSEWILEYFIKDPDVYVANIEQFRTLVEGYAKDPCV